MSGLDRAAALSPGGPRTAYGATTIRSSTLVTPGADQATRSASSRSIHERTVPLRITLASIRFDLDAVGVDFSTPSQCIYNPGLDLSRLYLRFELDRIGDVLDSSDPPDGIFGGLLLILPLDLSFERHHAVLHHHLDMLR